MATESELHLMGSPENWWVWLVVGVIFIFSSVIIYRKCVKPVFYEQTNNSNVSINRDLLTDRCVNVRGVTVKTDDDDMPTNGETKPNEKIENNSKKSEYDSLLIRNKNNPTYPYGATVDVSQFHSQTNTLPSTGNTQNKEKTSKHCIYIYKCLLFIFFF